MNTKPHHYVRNLPEWELPCTDDLEYTLVKELAAKARWLGLGSGSLRDAFSDVVHDRLRPLVQAAVDEVLEYWLKGLGDGNNGRCPALCIELPYLEHSETTDPLTLTYCVDNGDKTRTELNRTTLEAVIFRYSEAVDLPVPIPGRARVMAAKLRELAQKLDER